MVHPVRLVVGAVLVDALERPTRVLSARRTGPPALAGLWELPGGKVEAGESAEDALEREIREELGVTIHRGAELVPDAGGCWPLTPGLEMRVWWCTVRTGEPQLSAAHDELRWLTTATLTDVPWLEPDRPLVERIGRALHPSGAAGTPTPGR